MKRSLGLALLAAALAAPAAVAAQVQNFLPVGQMAPDISLTGATRYGVLREPIRLSALRGKTVVLAYFSRARSIG